MRPYKAAVMMGLAVLLGGCATQGGVGHQQTVSSWGVPTTQGFKPASQVAPHAVAMVQGRETLAECMQRSESKADGGMGCLMAIEDMPVK